MTQTTYITDMAVRLTEECENYVVPVQRPRLENSIECLILLNALKHLHQALVKLAKLLEVVGDNS